MTARDRRVVTIGAVVVGAAVVFRLGVMAAAGLDRRLALLAETGGTIARAEALLGHGPTLEARRGAVATELTSRVEVLLDGSSPAEAAANLGDLVSSWASLHGLTVEQLTLQPDTTDGALVRVAVAIRLWGEEAGVVGWMEKIETGPRLLTLRRLALASRDGDVVAEATVAGWVGHAP